VGRARCGVGKNWRGWGERDITVRLGGGRGSVRIAGDRWGETGGVKGYRGKTRRGEVEAGESARDRVKGYSESTGDYQKKKFPPEAKR